ncbi:MAG TPA: glycoside hydrolase family 20 zincin-like fold domain-containing protein, partial [Planctomycetota bacterium]|nr:glycoside hydrolase family 20 zincin-like fold domain-containing protein [Planctomycetota bacterium]
MNLVPLPKKITPKTGTVSLSDGWRLDAPEALAALECLDDLAFLKPDGKKTLVLRIDKNAFSSPLSPHLSRTHVRERGERVGVRGRSDEGYRLDLAPTRIELAAATAAGIIRGVQTLRQLAREGECSACVIEDAPTLAIRGFHIDFRPKSYRLEYLLETIGRLAGLKVNCLLVEWE